MHAQACARDKAIRGPLIRCTCSMKGLGRLVFEGCNLHVVGYGLSKKKRKTVC